MQIRQLAPTDNREGFASGDVDLDRFFRKFAGQNQFRHHLGTTYIAVDDAERILGFATVAPGELQLDDLSNTLIRKLPRYPLPILRLARLGVHSEGQGLGIGTQLLRFVFSLSMKMATDYGCVGILVDAKEDAVPFYERFGFIPIDLEEGESGVRPVPKGMFLSIRKIKASAPGR